jgi:hypothetical protein
MDDRQSPNKRPLFDLRANPFHFLGVDPSATDQEIRDSCEAAISTTPAPAALLQLARDAILDPASRLFFELSYLVDSSKDQIATTCGILAQNTAAADVIDFARHLRPVSHANLIAHLGAHRSADSAVLSALVEAQASLDAGSIYATLKAIRAKADRASPSLVSVNQCLKQLFHTQARAVVASYSSLEEAALPLLACTYHTCGNRDPYRLEALERLLSVYHDALGSQPAAAATRIVSACDALSVQPADDWQLNELTTAINSWVLLSGPLIVWDAFHSCDSEGAEMIVKRLRALIDNLATEHYVDLTIYLADFLQCAFARILQSTSPFANDLERIERLSLDLKLTQLHDFFDNAGRLSSRRGEQRSVAPAILRSLRSDLQNPGIQDATGHNFENDQVPAPTRHQRPTKLRRPRRAPLVAAFFVVGLSTAVLFASKLHHSGVSTSSAVAQVPESEAEAIPPVGTGQHLVLSAVRYCHYQEERLKLMKPDVQGSEAAKAFNLLVVDYNSRCSDFFYQDSDLATVNAELVANQDRLATEAKQMIATWTNHPEVHPSSPVSKQDVR